MEDFERVNHRQRTSGVIALHWFRHGLRLHDNPALSYAAANAKKLYVMFTFDGESAGTKLIGYNRMKFLLESLHDLNCQLHSYGGQLLVFREKPLKVITRLHDVLGVNLVTFEQDCEPIWNERDEAVKEGCRELGIECREEVSHTLWDPKEVVDMNGGVPPLTYTMFLQVTSAIGEPPHPEERLDFSSVKFGIVPVGLAAELNLFAEIPTPEDLNVKCSHPADIEENSGSWIGGETQALLLFDMRLAVEADAFKRNFYLPNQARPDLLGPSRSLSPYLRYGCLSIRKMYWGIHDLFAEIHKGKPPCHVHLTAQLIWRDFFYAMSVGNPNYDRVKENPICLQIPWRHKQKELQQWKDGKTGFPFVDAVMRQLLREGWIHHVARNAVAQFLTRGGLWISWEDGLKVFLKHLLDADWSVCSGNWLWISSSAFETILDCSHCLSPVAYGRRLEPTGDYIR
ncbi:unnamed protein product [Darwinula stevensoni]|uniref:Cryptochrome-1 n=1 Tax=Darwinula stevensoni TaxID=69355 RepID=A0A7R8X5V6_9CRUS|nr:unnamed protein product [Darwinula stevensoni]CAG0887483.1 unnamed protein product [Darwinula stevensoni]